MIIPELRGLPMIWPQFFPSPTRKVPRWRFFGLAFGLSLGLHLTGCDRVEVERRYHPNGQLAEEKVLLVLPDGRRMPHGLQVRWRPDGSRLSLEVRNRGQRQGYVLEWNAAGQLQRGGDFEKDGATLVAR